MKIALLGSIPKGDAMRENWIDWKIEYIDVISREIPEVEFIHGDAISDSAGAEMVVGHDLLQVRDADICVVDARSKIGAGTAQEIVIAKYFHKPVVIVIPKNSHHRKSDITFHGSVVDEWIHPFLEISTDFVAESVEDAAGWIKKYSALPRLPTKDISVFEQAIASYEASVSQTRYM